MCPGRDAGEAKKLTRAVAIKRCLRGSRKDRAEELDIDHGSQLPGEGRGRDRSEGFELVDEAEDTQSDDLAGSELDAQLGIGVSQLLGQGDMQREGYEILMPQLAPIHMRLFAPVLCMAGYNVRLLEKASDDDIEVGLKYVNNDSCYPVIVVIGQLISQFLSGQADPDRTAVGITQTGGQCRATNYAGLLRKGLVDAGYPQVPVIALSAQGIESNPGFSITPKMLHKAFQAVTVGDVLQKVLLRTRPYQIDGNVDQLYEKWDRISRHWFTGRHFVPALKKRLGFGALIRAIVADFDAVELQQIPRKPRVGLVGEILVQFHPDANSHAVATIEAEGCEAELPSLAQFFHMSLINSHFKETIVGSLTTNQRRLSDFALWGMQQYEKFARTALAASDRFEPGPNTKPSKPLGRFQVLFFSSGGTHPEPTERTREADGPVRVRIHIKKFLEAKQLVAVYCGWQREDSDQFVYAVLVELLRRKILPRLDLSDEEAKRGIVGVAGLANCLFTG